MPKARDVALVAIRTNHSIEPVGLAKKTCDVEKGQKIFSIGCDHGESPTIRHSKIKNRAAYDGAIKYDIFGRPVDGRSGGGLFNESGELIGVCNAAAVEVDEGIYSALETMHWQIAQVNLDHLFQSNGRLAGDNSVTMPVPGASVKTEAIGGSGLARIQSRPERQPAVIPPVLLASRNLPGRIANGQNPVAWDNPQGGFDPTDTEVIIFVRSKSNPGQAQAITVSHPSVKLLRYLDSMQASNAQPREIDVAELRESIGSHAIGGATQLAR